jgi:hypothetical protein
MPLSEMSFSGGGPRDASLPMRRRESPESTDLTMAGRACGCAMFSEKASGSEEMMETCPRC